MKSIVNLESSQRKFMPLMQMNGPVGKFLQNEKVKSISFNSQLLRKKQWKLN